MKRAWIAASLLAGGAASVAAQAAPRDPDGYPYDDDTRYSTSTPYYFRGPAYYPYYSYYGPRYYSNFGSPRYYYAPTYRTTPVRPSPYDRPASSYRGGYPTTRGRYQAPTYRGSSSTAAPSGRAYGSRR